MQERQVTIGEETHPFPRPFLVMATQNPIESEGTYPLPEAQVDRFMLKVLVDYPAPRDELTVVERASPCPSPSQPALGRASCGAAGPHARVYVDPAVQRYAVSLAIATRQPATRASATSPATSRSAPARAGRSASCSPRARWPSCAAAATSCRRTSRARTRRPAPPHRPHLRGAGRGRPARHDRAAGARPSRAAARPRIPGRGRMSAGPRTPRRARRTGPARGPPGRRPAKASTCRSAADRRPHRRRSPLQRDGDGSELAQIRPYVPGDDVRRIDWNATARTGEPHVRVDVAERALTTWLVLDASASMTFGTADRRKWDVAEGVALALGQLASRRGNRLGLVTYGDREPARAAATGPGRPARRPHALREEPAHEAVGATSLGEALARRRARPRRSLSSSCRDFRGPRDWRRCCSSSRPPRGDRDRDPRPARAGAARRRRPRARRPRDRPPAPRRHPQPQAAPAVRGGGGRACGARHRPAPVGVRQSALSTVREWLRRLASGLRQTAGGRR